MKLDTVYYMKKGYKYGNQTKVIPAHADMNCKRVDILYNLYQKSDKIWP